MADVPKGLELLRQEVPEHLVGKLPKVTCPECRKKENRGECKDHRKRKCEECGGWLSTAHMHLDYVGHAETTAQLLVADVTWNWEPVAFDASGLPAFDADGGLWIKLTVCGVTRLGYGTADNANGFKSRGDIRKEIIGDALRNAAMRFGWALNLWAKTDIHDRAPQDDAESPPSGQLQRSNGAAPQNDQWATPDPAAATPRSQGADSARPSTSPQRTKLVLLVKDKRGITDDAQRHMVAEQLLGREVTSFKDLTFAEASKLIETLGSEPEHAAVPGPPEGWTTEQSDQLAADFLAELQGSTNDAARVEVAGRIAKAVKAGKITPQDRDTLLAAYNGGSRQPAGASA